MNKPFLVSDVEAATETAGPLDLDPNSEYHPRYVVLVNENLRRPVLKTCLLWILVVLVLLQVGVLMVADRLPKNATDMPSMDNVNSSTTSEGICRGSFDFDMALNAWEEIERQQYNEGIKSEDDKIAVVKKGDGCYIVSEESNSLGDWIQNFNFGDEDILGVHRITGRQPQCGCEFRLFRFCIQYHECSFYPVVGLGYQGFAVTYNAMRIEMYAEMKQKCDFENDKFFFAGYSRGGAIMTIAATSMFRENLIPADRLVLLTYGAPRSLDTKESNDFHLAFPQYRFVYRGDPIPALPPGKLGYRHIGKLVCCDCAFVPGRDAPGIGNLAYLQDHITYNKWFVN